MIELLLGVGIGIVATLVGAAVIGPALIRRRLQLPTVEERRTPLQLVEDLDDDPKVGGTD